ncbi:MAG: sigma-70 family RNA polymerase sigma factor, partial [Patescibacteria group bacterium]|nr:sigma-70 family RNA polymerase sigma factor [Patescibacteria group bacterium]
MERVEQYLKQLPSEQREIVIMRVWNEMSYQEIAEVLNKSEASCKMLFSRTINKLRSSLPLTIYILILINPLK